MDFVPHTSQDDDEMLERIGVADMAELFESIPDELLLGRALDVPPALSEPELLTHLAALSAASRSDLICFAGGGAYDHHLPPVVTALAGRAEFSTSYTPYQAELSQGVLQALFEFQTLVCELYGMEVSNASLYDGASALVEAVNLAVRSTGRTRIVVGSTVMPTYIQVLKTCTSGLGLDIVRADHDGEDGVVEWAGVDAAEAACLVVANPNFFGRLEDVRAAAGRAHDAGALLIAVADPTSLGILEAPGALGADVAVGEGYALGNPMAYGGPYLGLFATSSKLVRQVPGRIAGETLDRDGKRAYVLTLQAREQHIRRARATSNVCTNQTLMAIAAAAHLSWLGPGGLARLGEVCTRRLSLARSRLSALPGCRVRFDGPVFKELVLEVPGDAEELVRRVAVRGYLAGPSLGRWYEGLERCLLVAVTERRTEEDINGLVEAIEKELVEA